MATNNTPVPVPAGLLSKVKGAKVTTTIASGAAIPGPASVPAAAPIVVPAPVQAPAPAPADPVYGSILDVPNPAKVKPAPGPAPVKVKAPKPAKVHGVDLVPVKPAAVTGIDLVSAIGGTLFPIVLPEQLAAKISKPITGSGGWQKVMGDLQGQLTHQEGAGDVLVPVLSLTPHLLDRITTLSVKHGGGGYQAVMRWIVCLAMDQHKSKLLGVI